MKTKHSNLKINDKVMVISGKEKGKIGKILKFLPEKARVLVERVNMVKRHTKPSGAGSRSGIVEQEGSLPISNVALVCPKCIKATRIAHAFLDDGRKKVRVCKKCGEAMDDK